MTVLWIGYMVVAALLAVVATVVVARDIDSPTPRRDVILTYGVCALWLPALVAVAIFLVVTELRPVRDRRRYGRE